jgi:hypothetical protein
MRIAFATMLLLGTFIGCAGQEFGTNGEVPALGGAAGSGGAAAAAGQASGVGGSNVSGGGNGGSTAGTAGAGTGGASGTAGAGVGGATLTGGMAGSVAGMAGAIPSEAGPFADAVAPDSSKPDVCVETGVERCFDGIDNDCNGLADCADPACAAGATCIPDPALLDVAVRVAPDAACPNGFATPIDLRSGLNTGAGCTACGCTAGALTCQAEIAVLATNSGGPYACDSTVTSRLVRDADGCTFVANALGIGNLAGIKAAVACTPGTTAPLPATWASSVRLCKTADIGTGCEAGFVCAPIVQAPAAERCVVSAGSKPCPAGYATKGALYARYDDTRACSCACEGAGDCTGTSVVQYQDACTATPTVLATGSRTCTGGKHDWYAAITGTPAGKAICTPKPNVTGTLAPADPHTVCCY